MSTPGVSLFAAHNPQVYGSWADQNPGATGVSALTPFLQSQPVAAASALQVTTFTGPTAVNGSAAPTGFTPPAITPSH